MAIKKTSHSSCSNRRYILKLLFFHCDASFLGCKQSVSDHMFSWTGQLSLWANWQETPSKRKPQKVFQATCFSQGYVNQKLLSCKQYGNCMCIFAFIHIIFTLLHSCFFTSGPYLLKSYILNNIPPWHPQAIPLHPIISSSLSGSSQVTCVCKADWTESWILKLQSNWKGGACWGHRLVEGICEEWYFTEGCPVGS